MIPEALIVAFSGSVSNHWSRKSAALIVISWMNTARCSGRLLKERARRATGSHSRGLGRTEVGGAMDRIGLMNLAISNIRRLYSSYASASLADQRQSLAHGAAVVVHTPQVVVVERRERSVERQDLEAVLRQRELPDDLGAEQRDDVRGHAEPEAGEHLLGHRRPAENVSSLQHDHLESCPREVRRGDEPVVPAADDHGVVPAVIGGRQSGPIMLADMRPVRHGDGSAWSALAAQPLLRGDAAARPEGFTVYNHTLFPINYDDFEAEYWHLLNT